MGPTDEQRAVQTHCVKENSEDVECEIFFGGGGITVTDQIKYICMVCVCTTQDSRDTKRETADKYCHGLHVT